MVVGNRVCGVHAEPARTHTHTLEYVHLRRASGRRSYAAGFVVRTCATQHIWARTRPQKHMHISMRLVQWALTCMCMRLLVADRRPVHTPTGAHVHILGLVACGWRAEFMVWVLEHKYVTKYTRTS